MSDKRISPNNVYFANKPSNELATDALQKASSFYSLLGGTNAYLSQVADNWRFYYGQYGGAGFDGHKITMAGDQGELVSLPVNHFRNIAQHIYNMITSQRPTMEARSVNTDAKSLAQTYLANGVLDYYMREKGLEDAIKTASEMAIVLGSGYIKMEWNATSGEAYDFDPETGEMNYEGDIEFNNLSPFDVVFDGTRERYNPDWIITRTFKNRYDLIAKYPELESQILQIDSKTNLRNFRMTVWSNDDTDDIPVYEFFHKKTESVPMGRYLLFVNDDAVLLDAPLPYRSLPVFRMTPGNIMGTPYGYTPMFDIYPLQEAINSLYSTILSNQHAFGVQSIFIPNGANITTASLEGGMNIIEGNEPPIPIQFTQTPAEVFQFLQMLIEAVETLSGINSVTRGNPEQSLKSGNALALVQSMAIQYISGLQQSYVKLIEEVGTQMINNLKDFAKAPRVAAIVGKNNKTLLKEFTGDDLTSINRVIVDIGNPLAKTTAGRVQMAEQMMQMGVITKPQEYFQVIKTGQLDVMVEGDVHELILIKQENEALMAGKQPLVAPTEQHKLHIQEHRSVLADTDMKENAQIVQVVMSHIQAHMDALRNTDPALLQLLGEQPLPPAMPMTPPGMPQMGQDPETGAPVPQGGNGAGVDPALMQQNPGLPQAGEQINGQTLPKPAKPPKPFKQLPTNPADNIPQ